MTHEAMVRNQASFNSNSLSEGSILQRKYKSCEQHKTGEGTCVKCQAKIEAREPQLLPLIQTKLMVEQPNEKCEKETAQVAEQVIRIPADTAAVGTQLQPSRIQRMYGNCEEEEKLQTKEISEAMPKIASRIQSLQSGGQPLPNSARSFFEPRFGQDFSHVRVHVDSESAQFLNASAYTLGNNIVFREGYYRPVTESGKHLLAHELTHVVQQQGASKPMISRANFFPGFSPGPVFQQILHLAQALESSCDRNTPLTWSDFSGSPPRRSSHSAWTFTDERLEAFGSSQIIKTVFLSRRSWVKSQFSNPTNRSLNGCQPKIHQCQQLFDRASREGRIGTNSRLGTRTGCPAAARPDPSVVATSRHECESVIAPECDRVAQLESRRLLQHEQGHYDIACNIAQKGTLAILRGANSNRTLRSVRRLINQQIVRYDNDTDHGCNDFAQRAWESDIASGLLTVTIP